MRFAQIPSAVLDDLDVSAGALRLYAMLDWIAGKNGWCSPSERTLAERIGVSDRSVRVYLTQLKDRGHVVVTRRMTATGEPDTNMYVLPHRTTGGTGSRQPAGTGRKPKNLRKQTADKPESPKGDDQRAAYAPALRGPSLATFAEMLQKARDILSQPTSKRLTCFYGQEAKNVVSRFYDGDCNIEGLDSYPRRSAEEALEKGGFAYLLTESAFNEACKVSGFREGTRWIEAGELIPR
jgi:hypothetical protein